MEEVPQRNSGTIVDTAENQVTGTETNGHQIQDLQSNANQCNSNDNNDELMASNPLAEIISLFDDLYQVFNDTEYPEIINEVGAKQVIIKNYVKHNT